MRRIFLLKNLSKWVLKNILRKRVLHNLFQSDWNNSSTFDYQSLKIPLYEFLTFFERSSLSKDHFTCITDSQCANKQSWFRVPPWLLRRSMLLPILDAHNFLESSLCRHCHTCVARIHLTIIFRKSYSLKTGGCQGGGFRKLAGIQGFTETRYFLKIPPMCLPTSTDY